MPHHALLIDTLTPGTTRGLVATFFVLLAFSVGVGILGPDRSELASVATSSHVCDNIASCDLELSANLANLHPLQQSLSFSILLARPLNGSMFQLASGSAVSAQVLFYVDLTSDGTVETVNASHTRTVVWRGDSSYSRMSVLRISPLTVSSVDLAVRLVNPFAAFGNSTPGAAAVSSNVSASLVTRSVDEAYSVFEVTWRVLFTAASATVCIAFGAALRRHRGSAAIAAAVAAPASIAPPMRLAQAWAWWLCALLVPFNNPLFPLQARGAEACSVGVGAAMVSLYPEL